MRFARCDMLKRVEFALKGMHLMFEIFVLVSLMLPQCAIPHGLLNGQGQLAAEKLQSSIPSAVVRVAISTDHTAFIRPRPRKRQ